MKFQAKKVLSEGSQKVAPYGGPTEYKRMSEGDLWELFKGDAQVFNYVYLKYFPILYNYGHQFTKDRELVKDVIQDLFVYLKEKSRTLGNTTSIKFYLYKAYRRRINRYLKKSMRGGSLSDFNAMGFEVGLSHETRMIDSAMNEEVREKLEKAIGVLTQRQREIIIYYFFEDFSYKEITSLMGFSKVQYARILMSRSITKLRKELGDLKMIICLLIFIYINGLMQPTPLPPSFHFEVADQHSISDPPVPTARS